MHCSRRRLLRRELEFHECTINKSAYMKEVWKLIVCPSYIYIYIYWDKKKKVRCKMGNNLPKEKLIEQFFRGGVGWSDFKECGECPAKPGKRWFIRQMKRLIQFFFFFAWIWFFCALLYIRGRTVHLFLIPPQPPLSN